MFEGISAWFTAARWAITAILFAAVLGYAGWERYELVKAGADYAKLGSTLSSERADREREKSEHAQEREADEKQARTTEQELYAALTTNQEKLHAAKAADAARIADLNRQLLERPARPIEGQPHSGAVAAGACLAGCGTGAGLYRDDANVALWFATEAAKRAHERDFCYAEYESVRRALSEGQKQ